MSKPRRYRCIKSFNLELRNLFTNTNKTTMTCINQGETFVGGAVPWAWVGDFRLVADRDRLKLYLPERMLMEYFEEVYE